MKELLRQLKTSGSANMEQALAAGRRLLARIAAGRASLTAAALFVGLWMLSGAAALWAQSQKVAQPGDSKSNGSISLTPSVIMLKGKPGQSSRQTLRLTNNSSVNLGYELVALDVVVRDGKRAFVPAGQLAESIAATAVFSEKDVVVPAQKTVSVDVTLTAPANTTIRAVAAIFRTKQLTGRTANVGIATSLGTLITFNLSNEESLTPAAPDVIPQGSNQNLSISQWLTNSGKEPVIPGGVVAWLDKDGKLVGKTVVEPRRILPGERLEIRSEFPSELPTGRYRALVALQYGEKTLTSSKEFTVP
jgi:hypothetical protein